jgi:hypothetical protein
MEVSSEAEVNRGEDGSEERAESREQRTENREQRTENREQRTENRTSSKPWCLHFTTSWF